MRLFCRCLLALLVNLWLAQPVQAQQTTLDTDSFGGTNGDQLPTYNANWAIMDLTNVNNAVIRGTPGVGGANIAADLRNGFTWTNDQWAELTIDATTKADTRLMVCVRVVQGSGNNMTGYGGGVNLDITGGTYQIYKFSAPGTFTALVTGTHAYALGDVVNLQMVGTTLILLVNTVQEATVVDATYSTGSPGLIVGSQASRLAGTWKAGSVGAAAVVPRGMLLGVGP